MQILEIIGDGFLERNRHETYKSKDRKSRSILNPLNSF